MIEVKRLNWTLKICLQGCLLGLITLVLPAKVMAQTGGLAGNLAQLTRKHWDKSEGLQQSTVDDLLQTSDGYIWLATHGGLVRFDGVNFRQMEPVGLNQAGNRTVFCLHEDKDKALWAGTASGGLLRYRKGKFDRFTTKDGLPDDAIHDVTSDQLGNIWVGTRFGVAVIAPDGKISSFKLGDGQDQDVHALVVNKAGELFAGTKKGLYKKQGQQFDLINPKLGDVHGLFLGRDELLWACTKTGLIGLRENKVVITYNKANGLSDNQVNAVLEDAEGHIWVGTQHGGLCRIFNGKIEKLTIQDGLTTNRILTLFLDREGSLWMGTYLGGLYKFNEGKFNNITDADGLGDNTATVTFQDSIGGVWIGTVSAGLTHFFGGKTRTYTTADGLPHNYIRAIAQDKSGNLWIGTYGGGLSKFSGGRFTNYSTAQGLPDNLVRCIYPDYDGTIWVGTRKGIAKFTGKGFMMIEAETGQDSSKSQPPPSPTLDDDDTPNDNPNSDNSSSRTPKTDSVVPKTMVSPGTKSEQKNYQLAGVPILAIYRDRAGTLWVGTEGQKLMRLINNKFVTVQAIVGDIVYSIYQDAQGVLWFGTNTGISKLENGVMFSFSMRDGLPAQSAFHILEDSQQNLWVSSGNGVYRVSKKSLEVSAEAVEAARTNNDHSGLNEYPHPPIEYIIYNEGDGMISSECSAFASPSAMRDDSGKLWFSTTAGVSVLDPAHIRINQTPPPVVVEQILVDYLDLQSYDQDSEESTLEAPAGSTRFQFNFTALSLINPDKVRFKYKLEGFDNDWIDAGKMRSAFYTNLKPGHYKFQVIACNNDGIWNEVGANVVFYVKPYLWQATWFWGVVVMVVGFVGLSLYRWRVSVLNQRAALLEQTVKARTREIRLRVQELETIDEMVQHINAESDLNQLLNLALSRLITLFPQAKRGSFLLYDPPQNCYHFAATHGFEEGFAWQKYIVTRQHLRDLLKTATVTRQEHAYILPAPLEFYKVLDLPMKPPASLLALTVPLGEEALYGVIFIETDLDVQAFNPDDLDRLMRFRVHTSTAFAKAQTLAEIQRQKHSLSEAYFKIQDSIDYAHKIQDAMLPLLEDIRRGFSDSFVFFRPRDVVSGDFYWYIEYQGLYLIAAVDCTGHGVPGAFMSLIGSTLLHQIVVGRNITTPAIILKELNNEVMRHLKQGEPGSRTRDGMDIALCCVDPKNRVVQFAGAGRPLYHIDAQTQTLTDIDGVKVSIGGKLSNPEQTFINHSFNYQPGDAIYMFSDGYPDQFGAGHRRKFLTSQLKKVLLEHFHRPMVEQGAVLERTMDNWQKDTRQLDDMLVIGIRLS